MRKWKNWLMPSEFQIDKKKLVINWFIFKKNIVQKKKIIKIKIRTKEYIYDLIFDQSNIAIKNHSPIETYIENVNFFLFKLSSKMSKTIIWRNSESIVKAITNRKAKSTIVRSRSVVLSTFSSFFSSFSYIFFVSFLFKILEDEVNEYFSLFSIPKVSFRTFTSLI